MEIFITAVLFILGINSELIQTPLNSYYVLGESSDSIILPCESNIDNSIEWYFKPFNEKESIRLKEKNNKTYEIQKSSNRETALIIKDVSRWTAGNYECVDGSSNPVYVEVVVFNGDPLYTSKNIYNYVEYCCGISYWGNITILITFLKDDEVIIASNEYNTNDMRVQYLCITINREETRKYRYKCDIHIQGGVWKHSYHNQHTFNEKYILLVEEKNFYTKLLVGLHWFIGIASFVLASLIGVLVYLFRKKITSCKKERPDERRESYIREEIVDDIHLGDADDEGVFIPLEDAGNEEREPVIIVESVRELETSL